MLGASHAAAVVDFTRSGATTTAAASAQQKTTEGASGSTAGDTATSRVSPTAASKAACCG